MNKEHIAGWQEGCCGQLLLKKLLWICTGCLHWLLGWKGCDMIGLPLGKPSCLKEDREKNRTATALPRMFAGAPLLMRSLTVLKAGHLTVYYRLH